MIALMKIVERQLTYSELPLMPDDGKRYELVDGEVFVSAARNVKHQKVLGHLYLRMGDFVETHKLGVVFVAPLDVVFGEKKRRGT